jgi:hypothetical protein
MKNKIIICDQGYIQDYDLARLKGDLSMQKCHYSTVHLTSIYLHQNGYKFAATPGAQAIKFYGCKD